MARQILPTLDLRGTAERQGITSTQQTIQAIAGILQTAGAAIQKSRERETLDRITRAIGAGKTSIEAIAEAAKQEQDLGGGLGGGVRRIAGAFAPQQGGIEQRIQQTIIGEKLKQALTPKLQIPEGLEASSATVGPGGRVTQRFTKPKAPKPFEPTKAEKALDKDIKILTDRDRKGKLKASPIQQEKARSRLRKNPSLGEVQPGQIDYAELLEGKPKIKIGKLDKAFGEEAYTLALRDAKDEGLAAGATEASIEADFNAWWDKQVEKEKEDVFREFVPRSEFQVVTESEQPEESTGAITIPRTQAKFDAIPSGTEFRDIDGRIKVKR